MALRISAGRSTKFGPFRGGLEHVSGRVAFERDVEETWNAGLEGSFNKVFGPTVKGFSFAFSFAVAGPFDVAGPEELVELCFDFFADLAISEAVGVRYALLEISSI